MNWISVEEKLPPLDRLVLFCTSEPDIYIGTYCKRINGSMAWHFVASRFFSPKDVTNWMPLPELPKDENEQRD